MRQQRLAGTYNVSGPTTFPTGSNASGTFTVRNAAAPYVLRAERSGDGFPAITLNGGRLVITAADFARADVVEKSIVVGRAIP